LLRDPNDALLALDIPASSHSPGERRGAPQRRRRRTLWPTPAAAAT